MKFSHINFAPISGSGDDVTGALKKLDLNFSDLEQALSPEGEVGGEIKSMQDSIDNLGDRLGWRNRIINGNFDVWQRGATAPMASSRRYLADRWQLWAVESSMDASRIVLDGSMPGQPEGARYALRTNVSSARTATSYAILAQSVEGASNFAGGNATLSFHVAAGSAAVVGVELVQINGARTVTGIGSKRFAIPLANAWTRCAMSITVPAINVPEEAGSQLQLIFWIDAGSQADARSSGVGNQSGSFWFSQVQLESGTAATPFEKRPLAIELPLCERYYQKSFGIDQVPTSAVSAQPRANMVYADTGVVATVPLRVRMRTPPAVTFWGSTTVPSSGNNWVLLTGGGWQVGQTAIFTGGDSEFSCTTIYPGGGFNTIKSIYVQGGWTADAEF